MVAHFSNRGLLRTFFVGGVQQSSFESQKIINTLKSWYSDNIVNTMN